MIAAILCPGPSLPDTWRESDRDRYVTVIGVNRAVLHARCDWWSLCDHHTFLHNEAAAIGRPTVWTTKASDDSLTRRQRWGDWERRIIDQTIDVRDWPAGACLYSMSAAIVLAMLEGCDAVDLYGNDQTAAPDFDGGEPQGCVRTPTRWDSERGVVKLLSEVRGVKVRRVAAY